MPTKHRAMRPRTNPLCAARRVTQQATLALLVTITLMTPMMPLAAVGQTRDQPSARPAESAKQWTRFDLTTNGISLRVPLGVFERKSADEQAQGQLFTSRDGQARLLVGGFANVEKSSPAAYQKFVIANSYPSATIDYAPLRRNWFVVSGTMQGLTFYQRVTFTCNGQLINSWAMIYPTTEKAFYDGLINQMHRSFRPGRGPAGDCQLTSATN